MMGGFQEDKEQVRRTTVHCNAMDCLFYYKGICNKPNIIIELDRTYIENKGFILHFICKDYYSP
jgi:hypothetical protein